jgi:hypothetical protein
VEQAIGHDFRHQGPIRQILDLAAAPGGPTHGVVLDERTPAFDALDAAVRARLADATKLRATTEFATYDQVAFAPACAGCS